MFNGFTELAGWGPRVVQLQQGDLVLLGTMVGDTPAYLYQGHWTPPCCQDGIEQGRREDDSLDKILLKT